MNDTPKPAPDRLTTTTADGKIELTEEELGRVTGGRKAGDKAYEFLTIKLTDILIT